MAQKLAIGATLLRLIVFAFILPPLVLSAEEKQGAAAFDPDHPPTVPSRKIWGGEQHCAFTDLIRFRGRFYCSFREGDGHVGGRDGVARIIVSVDGESWNSAAVLKAKGFDLRDPKLSVTPDGRLMVVLGGSDYQGEKCVRLVPHVAFSDEAGEKFSAPKPLSLDESIRSNWDWLWRVTWEKGTGYGVVYQSDPALKDNAVHLVRTTDGVSYQAVTKFAVTGKPNEATLRVMSDGELLCLLRRGGGDKHGHLGRAKPPYADWTWNDTGYYLGGPNFVALPDGQLLVGARRMLNGKPFTWLFVSNRAGRLRELLQLPSGGDTSYPGMLLHAGSVWISYYSSHEGKASIYLAKIPLERIKADSEK